MKELFQRTGVMAIATRLRLLSERMTKESESIFALYNVDIKPKWYPVVYSLLNSKKPTTVTQIANEIGHSHVSVVKIIKEMSKAGMLNEEKDLKDARKTNLSLSDKGKEIVSGLENQHRDTTIAIEKMLSGTEHNLWLALDEFETLLDEKSTYPRVLEEQKRRESQNVEIVTFEEKYAKDFERLNREWIEEYFSVEEKDREQLEKPFENIINKGGKILIALYNGEAVGACSLPKLNNSKYDYELSKMGVTKSAQGKGIGYLLGKEILKEAKNLGAKSIFIETNTVLQPAITLYKKLGFKQIIQQTSDYKRSNYQMELFL